jgi:hypothetical protein
MHAIYDQAHTFVYFPSFFLLVSGECTVEYDRSEKNCFTLQTQMKIVYRGSMEESNLVEDYVQSIVHKQIAQDPSQLFAMDIIGLHWANESVSKPDVQVDIEDPQDGNKTRPFDTPIRDKPTTTTAGRSIMSPQILIPVSTGIVVLIMWIIFHMYSRKKLRQHTKTASVFQASKERRVDDLETGSVTTAPTISPANSGHDFAGDFGTPERQSTISSPQEKPSGLLRDKPVRRSNPVSVDSPDRKPLPVSVDSPDRSAAGLPPRPPRRSIKLKTNRRKKKKKSKKVVPLKRVNSREGINEMPMISESDEDSELGSEGDSEYTSDDGSSIDASSGCLTPARSSSLSLKSSRASSPQLSPRDEFFAADVFDQDVKFVIEAPDFPNLMFSKERNTDNKSRNDPDVPPAPMLSKRSLSSERLANCLKQELKKLEIEPRARDESMIEDGDSPKRRLPLPWLK